MQQLLRDRAGQSRVFCCAPKLCMFLDDEDYPARILRPSKAYLILSTCIHIVDKLLKYHACDCKEHVVFNTINWKNTCFYPKKLTKGFAAAIMEIMNTDRQQKDEKKCHGLWHIIQKKII